MSIKIDRESIRNYLKVLNQKKEFKNVYKVMSRSF